MMIFTWGLRVMNKLSVKTLFRSNNTVYLVILETYEMPITWHGQKKILNKLKKELFFKTVILMQTRLYLNTSKIKIFTSLFFLVSSIYNITNFPFFKYFIISSLVCWWNKSVCIGMWSKMKLFHHCLYSKLYCSSS